MNLFSIFFCLTRKHPFFFFGANEHVTSKIRAQLQHFVCPEFISISKNGNFPFFLHHERPNYETDPFPRL